MKKETLGTIILGVAALASVGFYLYKKRNQNSQSHFMPVDKVVQNINPPPPATLIPADELKTYHRDQLEELWPTASNDQRSLIISELTRRGYSIVRSKQDPNYLRVVTEGSKGTLSNILLN